MSLVSDMPAIEVKINNIVLPPDLRAAMLEVDVQDDLDAPSACTLKFLAWDPVKLDLSRVDDARFDIGSEVEIKLGVPTRLTSVILADIVSVELELSSEQAPALVVRAYSLLHRLRRGTRIWTFENMKDSDMAVQIAHNNKLTPRVTDSGVVRRYVAQDGKSDLEFLRERAAGIGYEVVVESKDLVFRPVPTTPPETLVLTAGTDLTQLTVDVKAVDPVDSVEVRGWNPDTQQAIVGTAEAAGKGPAGASAGAAAGKATRQVVDQAVTTQEQAERAAAAEMERCARRSAGVSGGCLGRTDLRAGVVIDLQGAGARFSGAYRLTAVTQRFSPKSGFQTSFSGERSTT